MKKNRKKSFIRNCLIQNSISLLSILGVCLIISTFVNYRLEISFPVIDDLLKYEKYLKYEEYSKIPILKFFECAIIVYDSNNKMLYASDKTISEEFNVEDLTYINEKYNSKFFRVYDFIKENNEKQYYIIKIESNNGIENIQDFAVINQNLEVIDGGLFSTQKQISQYQFDLIIGKYKDYSIEKYQYKNVEGRLRTLVFLMPNFNTENYEKLIRETNNLWLVSIPIILIIIIVEMILHKKMLKKSIEPLNSFINSYKNKKQSSIDTEEISIEFQPIANNFKILIDKIKTNEIEKNKMIANISHDLKTSLTAIQGYSQAFKDNIVQEHKKEQYLTAIHDKTIIATDLINRLFEYSKLEHPDYQLKLKKIEINKFSKEYLAKKYQEIEINGFVLNVEIPEDKYVCCIDTELFTRLYDNLISNILKHNKSGTQILFKIFSQKDTVKIIVADNGRGIPNNIKENLFNPFVTGNKARTSGEGTGLGMTIIKKIVDLHNGRIYLKDITCQGYVTEFNIELKKSS